METQLTPAPTQSAHQVDTRRWLLLVVVSCATMMGTLDAFIVNVAVPSIERELHASFAEVQLVVAGYTLAYAVLLVTGGRLGDLYGRKRLFLLGVAGFTLFSALCGFAPSPGWLIAFRIAKGALAALMIPQVISFIQISFEPRERQAAFGAYAAINGLASILGQVAGGALLDANIFGLGWRIIFLVNVPIGIIVSLAAMLLIRESRVSEARGLDYGGAALLMLTLFLLVFPLVRGAEVGWPLWALGCLALSVPCMIFFVIYEQRLTTQGQTPLISLALFRLPRFAAGIATIMLSGAIFASLMFLLAFYLQTILRFTPLQSGLAFMPASISFILASSLSPLFVSRLGHRSLSVTAALAALGYLLVLIAVRFLVPLWGVSPLLVALFALGYGMGALGTPLMHKTLEGVIQDHIGAASGIYTTASQIAGALGVAIIGLIFATLTSSSGRPLYAFVMSLLVITLLSLGLLLSVRPFSKTRQP